MDDGQEKQRGAKRRLTVKQEEFVKKAIAGNAPATLAIDEPEWNRAAIAKLISRNYEGLVVSERTITDYRKRWAIKPPSKLTAKGGRPSHQIDALTMGVIDDLLQLSGLSVSQLFLQLSQDDYMAPLIGKKASFYNRLNEAGLCAVERKPSTLQKMVNRFCMRLRILVFPIKVDTNGEEKYAGLLFGYEVATGLITCRVFDIQVPSDAIAEPIYSATAQRGVCILKGSTSVTVYFPVGVVAEFVKNSYRRLGLPVAKLEITQQFFPSTSNYGELERAVEQMVSAPKTKDEAGSTVTKMTEASVTPIMKVGIEIQHRPVTLLTPLPVTLAQLVSAIKACVNVHNNDVAYPAIHKFKREIRGILATNTKSSWPKKPPPTEVRQLQEFCRLHPLHEAQLGPLSCHPRRLNGCFVLPPAYGDAPPQDFSDEASDLDD